MALNLVATRRRKLNDDRDVIRLIAVHGRNWVAEPAETFGAPFEISAAEFASHYNVKASDAEVPDTTEFRILLERQHATQIELEQAFPQSAPETDDDA